MLCARELLLWLLVCERACRYFLKVSNGRALGEYSEKLGFVSLFYLPRAHWRGRGWDAEIGTFRSARGHRCGVVP